MLQNKQQIHDYIQKHRDEMVHVLKELVKIPSVRGEAQPGAPFGEACANALAYMDKLYQENGFETELQQEDGYLLAFYGNGPKSLGLFAHADVVPVGDNWAYTDPFEPVEKDGFIIGRGVLDDKSAVVIALYCAKMLKELHIPFQSRLVCFTGVNEESGMQDIGNYNKKYNGPDFALVCDTGFPLYRGNKGIVRFIATAQNSFEEIIDFSGGESFNIILGKAVARLKYNDTIYRSMKGNQNDRISFLVENGEIVITAEGISGHGALPEGSLNAGYILAKALADCEGLNQKDQKQIEFVRDLLSDDYGKSFGIDCEDSEFGKLTCTNGMVSVKDGKCVLSFDVRFGKSADGESLKKKITETLSHSSWSVEFVRAVNAHVVPERNTYIQACLKVYKQYTGDTNAKAYINAGGTYAMHLPCTAEIGPSLYGGVPDGMPGGHGRAHQSDECIHIDGMLEALELTMLMLLECDKN